MRHTIALALVPLAAFVAHIAPHRSLETVAPNDNRRPAGTLRNGTLTVSLEARSGTWRPEGDQGRALDVAAFGEPEAPLFTPGPLIRVPVGTRVRATIRNTFDAPLIVFGLGKTRGLTDSVVVPAKSTREVSFTPSVPGTFYYIARRTLDEYGSRPPEDLQLNGAIVVDPPRTGTAAPDRILVIHWWEKLDPKSKTGLERGIMAINGLSWPHTERLDYAQGDSIHWRVINVSDIAHPMHLHGFYFRLESRGNGVVDSLYARDQQRMAVTEIVDPFKTLSLSWKAERPGNWIFHCHFALHLSPLVALDMEKGEMDESMLSQHMGGDAPHQMFGLVMGIRVAARGPQMQSTGIARPIRVLVRERQNVYGTQPGFAFVLGGTADETNPDAMPVPGAPLVLERGQPVAITVVNQSTDHASIHWHGIELESYPDGVPGWSGSGTSILPSIAPHDSLTVRFTPPRSGTFMYHSHFNEAKQMGGGAYGPIIVVEPGQRYDPETDKILFFGTAGTTTNVVFGPYAKFIMNGQTQPAAMQLEAGTRYRFRLLNLAGDEQTVVSMKAGNTPVRWKFVAKDGYTLPASQVKTQRAVLGFDPGEIYDYEYTPTKHGELTLNFGPQPLPPGVTLPPAFSPSSPTVSVPVHVRAKARP
jgi:FtsP/CotA-like multicopper oxidase with cupredoxin domain